MANDIDARLADWEARLNRLDENEEHAASPEWNGGYLVFVPGPTGYQLVERTGSVPAQGDVVELDDEIARYVVSRVIRSPLPADARPCVYLALI